MRLPRPGIILASLVFLSGLPVSMQAQQHDGRTEADESLAFVERAAAERRGPNGAEWARRMASEHERLVQALETLIESGHDQKALRFVAAAGSFWDGEHAAYGRELAERVLALPGAQADTPARVQVLYHAGAFAFRLRDQDAARARTRESVELARRIGDREGEVLALASLARVSLRDGEHDVVREHGEAALELAREIGDRFGEANARHMLAFSALMQDHLDRAAELFQRNLQLGREMGNARMVRVEAGNLAEIELRRGNLAEARRLNTESLQLSQEAGNRTGVAYALLTFGYLAGAEGDPALAVRLIAASEAAFASMGTTMDPGNQENIDRALAQARAQLGPAEFEQALVEGRLLSLEQAMAEAIARN